MREPPVNGLLADELSNDLLALCITWIEARELQDQGPAIILTGLTEALAKAIGSAATSRDGEPLDNAAYHLGLAKAHLNVMVPVHTRNRAKTATQPEEAA